MADENPDKNTSASERPEDVIRDTLKKIAKAIGDATEMTVDTQARVLQTGDQLGFAGQAQSVATTTIKIDGDRTLIVPLQVEGSGALTVPKELYDLHERHVAEAQAFRKELLKMLVDWLPKPR